MKLGKVLPIILGLGLMLPFGNQSVAEGEMPVRVELTVPFASGSQEALQTIAFTVNGSYMIEGQPSLVLLAGQKYFVQIENGLLSLYQSEQVGFLPLAQGLSTLTVTPTLPAGGSTVKIEAKDPTSYRGAIEFRIGYKGTQPRIVPINVVGMESYLKGVVPSEMPASWNREALKAQAVAARTYAVRHMKTKPGDGYINDTVQYQAYKGTKNEKDNSNQAVEETRGEVLAYNGSLIDALYSSSNGGYTEAPENVWQSSKGAPYLQAKPDPYDARSGSPDRSWEQTLTIAQMQDKLKSRTPMVGTIKKVEVKQTYASGRVADLVIEGDKGVINLSKESARTVLGLKSALYTVKTNGGTSVPTPGTEQVSVYNGAATAKKGTGELYVSNGSSVSPATSALVIQGAAQKKAANPATGTGTGEQTVPTSVVFSGKGWGHGVGMSQWGAQQMAKEGKSYQDILSFYYAPAQISPGYGSAN